MKYLDVVDLGIGGCVSCQKYRITKISRSVCHVIAGIANFTGHGHNGWVFEIKPSKNPHRIEWLEGKVLVVARESVAQIERNDFGLQVGPVQPNDFRMLLVGFRQNV